MSRGRGNHTSSLTLSGLISIRITQWKYQCPSSQPWRLHQWWHIHIHIADAALRKGVRFGGALFDQRIFCLGHPHGLTYTTKTVDGVSKVYNGLLHEDISDTEVTSQLKNESQLKLLTQTFPHLEILMLNIKGGLFWKCKTVPDSGEVLCWHHRVPANQDSAQLVSASSSQNWFIDSFSPGEKRFDHGENVC